MPLRRDDGPIRPSVTLALLSIAHAVNHSLWALIPLVYLAITSEFGIGAGAIAFLTAFGNLAAGIIQLAYGWLTRVVSRRAVLVAGGIVFGVSMAAQALASSFAAFGLANIASRIGGTPQHTVGNALLAEQFPPHRRAFAIAAHIVGGNVGTVAAPIIGLWVISAYGWRPALVICGLAAILVGLAMLVFLRESGADRAAARAHGSVADAYRSILRDRDIRWLYLTSILSGGGRGMGVVNVFAPLYLSRVLGIDGATIGAMYAVLLVGSIPGPLVAGWLSDRLGRRPTIIGVYLAGAVALVMFVSVGTSLVGLWTATVLLAAFNFAESPQLQALLGDIAPPETRDVSYATFFTLAFGVGSLWVLVYGVVIDLLGEAVGLPLVFWLMGLAFVAAAVAVLPIREPVLHPGEARTEVFGGDE